MADELNREKIWINEFNNIVIVDPNKLIGQDGKEIERMVKHEELAIYANLTARVFPRSKLSQDSTSGPQIILELDAQNVNFMKPNGDLTSNWTEQFTNPSTDTTKNQNYFKPNKEGFGITNITVSYDTAYIPQVAIEFIDIRGKNLFEHTDDPNSPYTAFFNFPYPTFELILKGFYGKAVKYQLSLIKFSGRFDKGNFIVSTNFVGQTYALLSDITISEMMHAPYMFALAQNPLPQPITTIDNNTVLNSRDGTVINSRGTQVLHEIYAEYKQKGLYDINNPELALYDLVILTQNINNIIENTLNKVDFDKLNQAELFSKSLSDYKNVLSNFSNKYLNSVPNNNGLFVFKKEYDDNKKSVANIDLQRSIKNYRQIFENIIEYKFLNLDTILPIDEVPFYVNGEFQLGIYYNQLSDVEKDFIINKNTYENDITKQVNDIVVTTLRFRPTLRNIIAILCANAETFIRLLDETHTKAYNIKVTPERRKLFLNNNMESVEKDKDIIYPWPLYYIDKSADKCLTSYELKYLGSTDLRNITGDRNIWPEIDFVENFIEATTMVTPTRLSLYNTDQTNKKIISPIELFNLAYVYDSSLLINTLYEIWDRSIYSTYYNGYSTRLNLSSATDNFINTLGILESNNIKIAADSSVVIKEFLKTNSFNTVDDFTNQLRSISPNQRYPLLLTQNFNTNYIKDFFDNGSKIYKFSDFENRVPLIIDDVSKNNIDAFLKQSKTELTITDTYPFTDISGWTKINIANGNNKNINQLYNILGSLFVDTRSKILTDKINSSGRYINFNYFTDTNFINFSGSADTIYNEKYSENNFNTNNSWRNFYGTKVSSTPTSNSPFPYTQPSFINNSNQNISVNRNKIFLTEGKIDYGINYNPQKISSEQMISLINTPYFINALLEGINNERVSGVTPSYITASYLFLNSLPLNTFKELMIDDNLTSGSGNKYGNYLFSSFNQISAVHNIPLVWLLKIGSIWHRYKEYINSGVDILDNCWTDFDYVTYFSTAGTLSYNYTLTGTNTNICLQNSVNPNQDIIDNGFYPLLINEINYFVTGKELFPSYDDSGLNYLINSDILRLNKITNNTIENPIGWNLTNTASTQTLNLWSCYSNLDPDVYIIYPSIGGSGISQVKQELQYPDPLLPSSTLYEDLRNRTEINNGSIKSIWGLSSYGYFNDTAAFKPKPYQYLKVIDNTKDEQFAFTLATNDRYSSIEDLLSVFNKQSLDQFETLFFNFSKSSSQYVINNSTINQFNEIYPTFQDVFRSLLKVGKSTINSDVLKDISKQQIFSGIENIQKLMSVYTSYIHTNPNNINMKILKSFIGDNIFNGNILYGEAFGVYDGLQTPEFVNELKLNFGIYTNPLLDYNNPANYFFSFFSDNNIKENESNVENLKKIIDIWITNKINNSGYTSSDLSTTIKTLISNIEGERDTFLLKTLTNSKKVIPDLTKSDTDIKFSQLNDDNLKLEFYRTFKSFNDKWVSGMDVGNNNLLSQFLFLDKGNRDIGDNILINFSFLSNLNDSTNMKNSFFGLLGSIFKNNFINFLPLPSYINFWGGKLNDNGTIDLSSQANTAEDTFGTFLEVDLAKSGPKFLCQYIGNESENLDVKDPIAKYKSDSFFIDNHEANPLLSSCQNFEKSNKVVAFFVDYGIQNQNMFYDISLDMKEDGKLTGEYFTVFQDLIDQKGGKSLAVGGVNLFEIYKRRSYACKITMLGDMCIQPTMYFQLRYIPIFNGAYLITDVKHTITPNNIVTEFVGTRQSIFSLPTPESFLISINKSYLQTAKLLASQKEQLILSGYTGHILSNNLWNNNGALSEFIKPTSQGIGQVIDSYGTIRGGNTMNEMEIDVIGETSVYSIGDGIIQTIQYNNSDDGIEVTIIYKNIKVDSSYTGDITVNYKHLKIFSWKIIDQNGKDNIIVDAPNPRYINRNDNQTLIDLRSKNIKILKGWEIGISGNGLELSSGANSTSGRIKGPHIAIESYKNNGKQEKFNPEYLFGLYPSR